MNVEAKENDVLVAREVIHRCNNFLGAIVANGEANLGSSDPNASKEALAIILQECSRMEEYLRQRRKELERR